MLACVAVAGALLAMVRMLAHSQRRTLFQNLWASIYIFVVAVCCGPTGWKLLKGERPEGSPGQAPQVTVPYGVPIFIGVCMGAVVVHVWI